MKKTFFFTIGLATFAALFASFGGIEVFAASTIPDYLRPENAPFALDKTTYEAKDGSTATILILQILAGTLLYFAAPVAVIMIAMSGLSMVTGGAETEKLEQSKKSLTWTILGLFLIILSYAAVRYVIGFITLAGTVVDTPTAEPAATGYYYHELTTPLGEGTEHLLS